MSLDGALVALSLFGVWSVLSLFALFFVMGGSRRD